MFFDAFGEVNTLGVRLDIELIAVRSSWDRLAPDRFFSFKSLERPMFEKFESANNPGRSVKLLDLEDILECGLVHILLGTPLDIRVPQ